MYEGKGAYELIFFISLNHDMLHVTRFPSLHKAPQPAPTFTKVIVYMASSMRWSWTPDRFQLIV